MERMTILSDAVIQATKQSAPINEHEPCTCLYNFFPLNTPYNLFEFYSTIYFI